MGATQSSTDFDEAILPSSDSSDGGEYGDRLIPSGPAPIRSTSCSSFTSTCLELEAGSLDQVQREWADYISTERRRELTLRSTLIAEKQSVEYLIDKIQALPLDERPVSLVLVSRIDDNASYGYHHPLGRPVPGKSIKPTSTRTTTTSTTKAMPMDRLFQLLSPNLQRLEIVNPHIETTMAIDMEMLQSAMRQFSRLESLTLVRLELSDARPIKERMLSYHTTQAPTDESHFHSYNYHQKGLRSLQLDCVSLSRHSCTELALGIQNYQGLRTLRMEKCDFRGGFRTIAQAIAKSPSRLQHCSLMMSSYPNVDALNEFTIILRGQVQLATLNLDGMLYPGQSDKLFNDFLRAIEKLSQLKKLSLNDWRIASEQKQALIAALAEPSHDSIEDSKGRRMGVAPQLEELNLLVTDGQQLVESLPIHGRWVQHLPRLNLKRLMVSVGKLNQARGPNDLDEISQSFYHNTNMTCFSDEEYFDHFYHCGIQQTVERNKRMARIKHLMLDATAAFSAEERQRICPAPLWPKVLAQTPTRPDEYELTSLYKLLSTRAHELPIVSARRRRPTNEP